MPFVKLVKTRSYFRRFQVKYRRRQEGKTDYYARKRLVAQDKTKFSTPKYRLVVRFTNTDIVAQIISAKIVGDFVLCAAYAHELPRYGIKLGLTNFAAAYATGLLLARRVLHKLKLNDKYPGIKEVNGKVEEVKALDDGPRPFKVLLDVGLVRTSTGHRVFAAMKGASDGGLLVPHNNKRLVGYNSEDGKFNADELRKHLLGGHVSAYMKKLQDENPDAYKRQFSRYIKEGIKPDQLESIYKKAHAAIRADPTHQNKAKKDVKPKRFNAKRITLEQRRKNIVAKKAKLAKAAV